MKGWKFFIFLLIAFVLILILAYFVLPADTRTYITEHLSQLGKLAVKAGLDGFALLGIIGLGFVLGMVVYFGIPIADRILDTGIEFTGWQITLILVAGGMIVFIAQLGIIIYAEQRPESWIHALTTIFGLWEPASNTNRMIPLLWGAYGFITYLMGYFLLRGIGNRGYLVRAS